MGQQECCSVLFYSIQCTLHVVKVLPKSAGQNGAQRNEDRLICGDSTEPVGIHDLKLAEHLAPVPERHSPLLCYLIGRKIQCLQKSRITRKDASLLVQAAVAAVQTFDCVSGVDNLPD